MGSYEGVLDIMVMKYKGPSFHDIRTGNAPTTGGKYPGPALNMSTDTLGIRETHINLKNF